MCSKEGEIAEGEIWGIVSNEAVPKEDEVGQMVPREVARKFIEELEQTDKSTDGASTDMPDASLGNSEEPIVADVFPEAADRRISFKSYKEFAGLDKDDNVKPQPVPALEPFLAPEMNKRNEAVLEGFAILKSRRSRNPQAGAQESRLLCGSSFFRYFFTDTP